jgi:hypothetical protein
VSRKGENPFGNLTFENGVKMSSVIPCYDPNPNDAYNDIAMNIGNWINSALATKKN